MNQPNQEQKHTPKVSIGMPVYNGEKFIRQAITSLLAQTFTNFELIISDNASTDGTDAICLEYASKDGRIRYVRQSENRGAPANFQFVLDEAVGAYFMWAAADDAWEPLFIEELVKILGANPETVVAFCEMDHVNLCNDVIRNYPLIRNTSISENESVGNKLFLNNSFQKYLFQNLLHGKVNIMYGLVRREKLILADVFKRWGNYGWGADLLMVASILRYGDVKFSPLLLWHKKLNPEGEGSLPPRKTKPNYSESIKGLMKTLSCYLNYVRGIWLVQASMKGAPKISTIKRLLFTSYELLRVVIAFNQQALRAIWKRLADKSRLTA